MKVLQFDTFVIACSIFLLVILVIIKFLSRNTGFNFSFVTKQVTLLFYLRQYYWQ